MADAARVGRRAASRQQVHVVQVDERVAPAADPDRNLAHLRASLLTRVPLPTDHIHAMPVEAADLDRAAAQYARRCGTWRARRQCSISFISVSDPMATRRRWCLEIRPSISPTPTLRWQVPTRRRRMTLTFPIINRSRLVLWLVTGREKAATLVRLRDGDPSIPAARVRQDRALLLADRAAAAARHQRRTGGAKMSAMASPAVDLP